MSRKMKKMVSDMNNLGRYRSSSMQKPHAFTSANFGFILSLEVISHLIDLSIFICKTQSKCWHMVRASAKFCHQLHMVKAVT